MRSQRLKIFSILFLLAFVFWGAASDGCFDIPHDWSIISIQSCDCFGSTFGFSEFFYQIDTKLRKYLSDTNRELKPIILRGIFSDPQVTEITDPWKKEFIKITPVGWTTCEANLSSQNDFTILEATAKSTPDSFSAFLEIKKLETSQINLVDRIFFSWAIIRVILCEKISGIIRILDGDGKLVFLDEIKISPTIISDILWSPNGIYFSHLEKNDSRRIVLDVGEIFPLSTNFKKEHH
ncbi:MAG: hypothetical protein HQM08_08165 [Candidatus Riflebacteria bacterium]|nr:hypothetical protein [Candidatus Riflebacteria bacterium]